MTSPNGQSNDLGAIKLQYIQEWEDGQRPTLQDYVVRYPEFEDELTEFVTDFLQLETVRIEDTLQPPSSAAERALARVLAGVFRPANSLREVRKGMGWSHAYIARELNLPPTVVVQLERGALRDWPAKLEARLSRTVCRTPAEVAVLLGVPSTSSAVAAHYCANGSPEPGSSPVRTFREALEECALRGELSDAQRREWLEETGT